MVNDAGKYAQKIAHKSVGIKTNSHH